MLTVSLILAGALAAQAPSTTPAAKDFVGRWNVRTHRQRGHVHGRRLPDPDRKDGGLAGDDRLALGQIRHPVKNQSTCRTAGSGSCARRRSPGSRSCSRRGSRAASSRGKVSYADGKVAPLRGQTTAPPLDRPRSRPSLGRAPVAHFDGKTLAGWKLRDPKAQLGWAVVNGELAVVEPKGNADLVSERAFQDQKLHVEFNVESRSNSGVYVRGRYEIQVLDNPDEKMARDSHGCGAVYSRIAPSRDAAKAAGEWQAYDITLIGRRVIVVLNGQSHRQRHHGITGGAIDSNEGEPGPLMLQGDHGKVRFRNIVVTPAR